MAADYSFATAIRPAGRRGGDFASAAVRYRHRTMADRILNQRWPWVTAAVLVIAAFLATFVDVGFRAPRPPGTAADIEKLAERTDVNVLFILVDTLRADRLGSYGYERDTSPLFDSIANSGVRFGRHLAQSTWTKSSMASLWTGMYPLRTGVTRFEHILADEATLASEVLEQSGFHTAGLWRNSWVEGAFGFAQGFDVYHKPAGIPLPETVRRENPTMKNVGSDNDMIPVAVEFLRMYGDERWFLYMHLMDVHEFTYDEGSAVFGTAYSDVYDNAVLRTNHVLGPLFQYLIDSKLLDKTLVVIASDHGEAFLERGLEGHARYVYRETTEVPFILGLPFVLEPGVHVDVRTQNVDIWPTLLDLLGLPPLPNTDGRSRVPDILAAARGESARDDDEPAFAFLDQNWGKREVSTAQTIAVADGKYRYVTGPAAHGQVGEAKFEELFDSEADAPELVSVLDEQPEVAERLRRQAQAYLEATPESWGVEAPTLEIDEMRLQQLRALGYQVP
jgi:arylsulfatase A-like enzyme